MGSAWPEVVSNPLLLSVPRPPPSWTLRQRLARTVLHFQDTFVQTQSPTSGSLCQVLEATCRALSSLAGRPRFGRPFRPAGPLRPSKVCLQPASLTGLASRDNNAGFCGLEKQGTSGFAVPEIPDTSLTLQLENLAKNFARDTERPSWASPICISSMPFLLQGLPFCVAGIGDFLALFRCISCRYCFGTDVQKPELLGAPGRVYTTLTVHFLPFTPNLRLAVLTSRQIYGSISTSFNDTFAGRVHSIFAAHNKLMLLLDTCSLCGCIPMNTLMRLRLNALGPSFGHCGNALKPQFVQQASWA